MQSTIAGMECFPPPNRHAYLEPDSFKRLVRAVKAGLDHPANLEKTRDGWRLRVKFRLPDGTSVRRSITLPDRETAEWVAGYLEKSRQVAAKRRLAAEKSASINDKHLDGDQP